MVTFVKALRSEQAAFFDTNPLANHVLNVIARRARRTPDPLNGLQIGECFVGHKGLGLSEQQYRTVKKNLQKWGLVEFKKAERLTDRGTVAKLLNSDIYDINEEDPNGRVTEDQRKGNGSLTEGQRQTKNVISEEVKNDKKKQLPAAADTDDEDYRFAEWMLSLITEQQPDFRMPNLASWANSIRLMREKDKRNHHDMARVWKWVRADDFWSPNVMSADKFRKQYDRLVAMTNRPTRQASKQSARDQIIADRNRELGIDQPPQQGTFIDGEVTRHD